MQPSWKAVWSSVVFSWSDEFPKNIASMRRTKIAKAIIMTEFTGREIPFL